MSSANNAPAAEGNGNGGTPPAPDSSPAGVTPRQGNNNTSNKKNKNKQNKNNGSRGSNTQKYKGVEEALAVLGVKNDMYKTDNFLVFQRSIENYVLSKFEHSGDIAFLIQEMKDPMPRLMRYMPTKKSLKKDYGIDPNKDEATLSDDEKAILGELDGLLATERKAFVARKSTLQSNYPKLFGLLWGQCTPSLQQDLRNLTKYKDAHDKRDCLWLLEELKKSSSGSDDSQHEVLTYIRIVRTLFTTRQRESETTQDMSDRLDSQLQALKLVGGNLHPPHLVEAYKKKHTNATDDEAKEAVEEKMLAIITIEGASDAKYSSLKRHLANQMVHGVDIYPDKRSQSHTLLAKFIPPEPTQKKQTNPNPTNQRGGQSNTNGGDTSRVNVTFHQRRAPEVEGPPVAGTDGEIHPNVTCFRCGRKGHYSNKCDKDEVMFQGVQYYAFMQRLDETSSKLIKDSWLLIDSGSTFSSVSNHHMLLQCLPCETMTSYTNGGNLSYSTIGQVAILPQISAYFNGQAIANIVSLSDVVEKYRVTMDSATKNAIFVYIDDDILEFMCCGNGLYYVDVMNLDKHKVKNDVNAYSQATPITLLNVANANKEFFTRKEIQRADEARLLQGRIGWPNNKDFGKFLNLGLIRNCVPTQEDITKGIAIYGPSKPLLQGKMTRKRPNYMQKAKRVQIPSPVIMHHPTDEVAVDFFFVQQRIYLLMRSRVYKFFGLNANCRGRGKIETSTAIKTFINAFGYRGISITCIHGDNEFEKIRPLVAPIHVETCGRDEHVPDIERGVRTIKERSRCTTSTLPFKRIPGVMIDANIQDKIFWLNYFPPTDYISNTVGPSGMILGTPSIDYNTLQLDFGQYCEVHDGTTNTLTPRSIGAIALRPKNTSGSYYFMSLETGKVIHSNHWTELAITDSVIKRVEEIAEKEGTPPLEDGQLSFEWEPGRPIVDIEVPDANAYDPGLTIEADTHPPVVFGDVTTNDHVDVVQGAEDTTAQGAINIEHTQIQGAESAQETSHPDVTEPTEDVYTTDNDDYLDNTDPFTTEPTEDDIDTTEHDDDEDEANTHDINVAMKDDISKEQVNNKANERQTREPNHQHFPEL